MDAPGEILATIASDARTTGSFGELNITGHRLTAAVLSDDVHAQYYVAITGEQEAEIGLSTPDRWVSESIEADLVHRGDTLEELLEDELVDLGCDRKLPVEHFRDEAKLYTFRSQLTWTSAENPASLLTTVLRAYEATFRQLGDLKSEEA